MSNNRLDVIVNREAGTARKLGHGRLLDLLQGVNRPVRLKWCHPSELTTYIQALVRAGSNKIVVGGGDGTINKAIQSLVGTNITLLPLPLGTMNHFVKDLQLPTRLEDFLPLLNSEKCRYIDVGCVNKQYFLNNVSLGMYPLVIRYRSIVRFYRRFPKLIATIYALTKVLLRHQSRRAYLWQTNKGNDIKSPMCLVANNHYKVDLRSLVHRKRLDRGSLMVVAPVDVKLLTLFNAILYAWTGLTEYAENLDIRSVSDIVIQTNSDYTHAVIDGELTKLNTPIKLHLKKTALRVIDSRQ